MTETTLAYLAGFLDGEGNIRIGKNGRQSYYLSLSATQVDPAPLQMFQSEFGGYLYRRERHRRATDGFNRQPIWDWVLHGPAAVAALGLLLPYLVVKAEAARLGIEFQSTIRPNGGPGSRRRLDGWELAERQSYAEALAVRSNYEVAGR